MLKALFALLAIAISGQFAQATMPDHMLREMCLQQNLPPELCNDMAPLAVMAPFQKELLDCRQLGLDPADCLPLPKTTQVQNLMDTLVILDIPADDYCRELGLEPEECRRLIF